MILGVGLFLVNDREESVYVTIEIPSKEEEKKPRDVKKDIKIE